MSHQAARALERHEVCSHQTTVSVASSNRFYRATGGLGVGRDMDITGSERRPLRAHNLRAHACIGVAMKQFLVTLLAVGVLASAAQAEARLVSTRAECVAVCDNAITQTCGWITKRGKFNRCRAKLINQCKRFGTDVMCPAQVAPPPPSSPTTVPSVPTTTTTTTPYYPPTTTTLPTVTNNPALPYAGTWSFVG